MSNPARKTPRDFPGNDLVRAALGGLLALTAQACGTTPSPTEGHITATQPVEGLTEDGFKMMCDAAGGTVETLAHCGGLASARGFSYDIQTQTLSAHSCKGANTCAGWNCITPDKG